MHDKNLQLLMYVIDKTGNSQDYDTLYYNAYDLMGTIDSSKNSPFSMNDMLADTDAYNIYYKLSSMNLADIFKNYYNSGTGKRFTDFSGHRDKEGIRSLAGEYTDPYYKFVVKWPLLTDVTVSKTQSIALRDAYTDFVWNMIQKEN